MNLRTRVAALMWLGFPLAAFACGSMGLDDPRTTFVLTAAVFVPMLALIPLELWFLRSLGGLRERFIGAYIACLTAKIAGVFLVAWAVQLKAVSGIVGAELTYSLGHFLVSSTVLFLVFKLSGKTLVACAGAISTIIPWSYSLGLVLIGSLAQ
jgi:hypothetical protein